MKEIDITGICKLDLLKELWINSTPAAFYGMSFSQPPSYDLEKAEEALQQDFIDYYCGRAIKTQLIGDSVDVSGYDRDFGDGAFERVVSILRGENISTLPPKQFPKLIKYEGINGCYFCAQCTSSIEIQEIARGPKTVVCNDCRQHDYFFLKFPGLT